MTIRDLTDAQRNKLIKDCEEMFNKRNKGLPVSEPLDWFEYRQAFSDGVQHTLKFMFPNKPKTQDGTTK